MSENTPAAGPAGPATPAAPFSAARAIVGGLIGLATHGVVFLVAFLTYRLWPGKSGGLEDLGIIVGTLLVGEAVLGLACLITGAFQFTHGRRDLGLGLVAGWIVGLAAVCLYSRFGM